MSDRLLHIYDGDFNWLMRTNAAGRSADLTIQVTGGTRGFLDELDKLVAKRLTFSRAVIDTHGNEGMIFFKGQVIRASTWARWANRGYHSIFARDARLYFTGCNVAESGEGWKFLSEAGKLFLRKNGGLVFAHDSVGIALGNPVYCAMAGLLFCLATRGKMIHPPWDIVRGVYIAAGGSHVTRVTLPY